MYRIFLILGLLAVLYFLLRSAFKGLKQNRIERGTPANKGQMVQDPVCGVFVPRESAIEQTIDGTTSYFCSRECATAFEKRSG
jgi:YHS domain-containing protein